jgi:PAS domain S-box-containing protein
MRPSYLNLDPKRYHLVAGLFHGLVLIFLWSSNLLVSDKFAYRNFYALKNQFVEPDLGPLGPFFMAYAFISSANAIRLWLKYRGKRQTSSNIFIIGLSVWLVLGAHDALAALGIPTIQYVMEYGFLGFSVGVLSLTVSDYIEMTDQVQKANTQLKIENTERKRAEERVEKRTAELAKANEQLRQKIEERKRAEKALRENEEKYRLHFENASDVIYSIDADFRLISVSPSVEGILGYKPEELIGQRFSDLYVVAAEYLENAVSDTLRVFAGEPISQSVYEFIAKDGTRKFGEVSASPLIRDGKVVAVVSVARDITKRRRAEEALRESDETARSLLNASVNAAFLIDTKDTILAANEIGAKNLGKSVNEIVGFSMADFSPTEVYKNRRRKGIEAILSGKPVRFEDEVKGRHFDTNVYPIFDEQGEVMRLAIFSRDTTARKLAEKQIQRSKTMLQSVFDGISDPLILIGGDLSMKVLNKAALQYYQAELPNVIGKECFKATKGISSPCKGCLISSAVLKGEHMTFGRKGFMDPERLEQVTVYPIKGGDNEARSAIIHITDVTEAKWMQGQLIQSEKLAGVGKLAAGMAHEINNPIMGIINYAQIMMDDANEEGRDADIPRRIIKEGERIAMIVQNLLSFARERTEEKGFVPIQSIVSDTFSLMASQLQKDSINIKLDVPDNLPPIWANSQQIEQVLLNLLDNARHALNQKFPGFHKDKLIEVKSEVIESDGVKMLRTIFYDRGTGIPEGVLDRIYDPFFSTKQAGEGTGLGLSISHGIIKDHGGKIQVESVEGKCTKVMVELPVPEEQEVHEER